MLLTALFFSYTAKVNAVPVEVFHPTRYVNGEPLDKEDIGLYHMCYITDSDDTCNLVRWVMVEGVIETKWFPKDTVAIKLRTIMLTGEMSEWSDALTPPKGTDDPTPPNLMLCRPR